MDTQSPKKKNILLWIIGVSDIISAFISLIGILSSCIERGWTITINEIIESLAPLQIYSIGAFIDLTLLIIIYKILEPSISFQNIKFPKWHVAVLVISIISLLTLSTIGVKQLILNYFNSNDEISIFSTTDYHSISDLPECNFDDKYFPCRYRTQPEEFAKDIALKAYNNITLSGRIMELYRDKNGNIPTLTNDKEIIIPDINQELNQEYYEYYFQLIEYPISQCSDLKEPNIPCWYISSDEENETYEMLATLYPWDIKVDCIKAANKTEWSNEGEGGLVPKEIKAGIMIVLPYCD